MSHVPPSVPVEREVAAGPVEEGSSPGGGATGRLGYGERVFRLRIPCDFPSSPIYCFIQ